MVLHDNFKLNYIPELQYVQICGFPELCSFKPCGRLKLITEPTRGRSPADGYVKELTNGSAGMWRKLRRDAVIRLATNAVCRNNINTYQSLNGKVPTVVDPGGGLNLCTTRRTKQ